ncbi:FAD-dependent monooxygenase [Sphingopyxis sp. J-6]|uniref:FAD-dependent monooxygenase n=1 Tax=Sphingopyxis sp. J-6 TaxID=3122054 RepID=UPI003984524F
MSRARKALVSGASIAGPTVAYWLDRHGFDVTVVERADALRSGGYAIDIRGTAIDAVERMGMLPELREAHIRTRHWRFRGPRGVIASIPMEDITGGVAGRDVEIPRGALAEILYARTRDNIPYRFNDCIVAMKEDRDGIDVTFRSGLEERYDVVIAADGLHSTTREQAFGPESQFSSYLGCCFIGFTAPNSFGFNHELNIYNVPGLAAGAYETGAERMNCLFAYRRPEPASSEYADLDGVRRDIRARYAGQGWIIPQLLDAMDAADDLYFDSMMQIHMPKWSSGRVAVVGDAAYGPSFFSGQGTSTAIAGAYVLAGELAAHDSHQAAFDAYDREARKFIEDNQATAYGGSDLMVPPTRLKLWKRNRMMNLAPILTRLGMMRQEERDINSSLKLKDYTPVTKAQAAA